MTSNLPTPDVPQHHSRRSFWLGIGLVLVVFLTINSGLVTGFDLPRWDAASYYAPMQTLVADHARAGRLLLWNPWTNAGKPDCADPQVGGFSPINVGVGLITGGTIAGFRIYWMIIWFLGGLGVALLARQLEAPNWAGIIGAIGLMFSGFYVGHMQHTSFLVSASFLPLILWRLDAAYTQRSWIAALQTGALWGLSALSGYPGLTIMNGTFCALWVFGRFLSRSDAPGSEPEEDHWSAAVRMIGVLSIVVSVGIAVLSPAFVSFFLEGRGYTDRAGALDRDRAIASNALHPGALSTLSSPVLAVVHASNRHQLWTETDPSSTNIYLFPFLLAAAVTAPFLRWNNRWRWWLFLVAAFFLMAAMGQALPVRGWLYDLFPPSRYFRHPAILRFYFVFSMIVLAIESARDLDRELRSGGRRAWRILGVVSGVLAAGAFTAFAWVTTNPLHIPAQLTPGRWWALGIWFSTVAIVGAVVFLNRTRANRTTIVLALMTLAVVDAWATTSLCSKFMFARDRISRQAFAAAERARNESLDLGRNGLDRELGFLYQEYQENWPNNLNLLSKTPTLKGYGPFASKFIKAWARDPVLSSSSIGADRFWFSPTMIETTRNKQTWAAFSARAHALGTPPLILHSIPLDPPPRQACDRIAALAPMEPASVSILKYSCNDMELLYSADKPGWLLVTDRFAPGWRASINGSEVPIRNANFGFRAIAISEGQNHIIFRYCPIGFPWFFLLSWALLGSIGLISLTALWRS